MDKLIALFEFGKYSSYILSSYGIMLVLFGTVFIVHWRRWRAIKKNNDR